MEANLVDFRTSLWRYAIRAPFSFLHTKLAKPKDGVMPMDSSAIPLMKLSDFLINSFFGVVLPTADVVTDLIFAIKLLTGFADQNGKSHPKFGIAMLCPIFLSMSFILYQWYQTEYRSTKSKIYKILTCVMVIVQFYPQFKTLEIIWHGYLWRDPEFNWKNEKTKLMMNIGFLGMYIIFYFHI